ncbi:MAG: P-loop NTPase [Caulobacter sp.]|nr:P-loop NTPase [Caulobacter sp.]
MDKPFWWRERRRDEQRIRRPTARVIVVGNEKGGAGKSTVAALIATAMMYRGSRVAVIDADLRQQSLSRFLSNRRRWLPAAGVEAPVPMEYKLADDTAALAMGDPARAVDCFEEAIGLAMAESDLVVVDTPGADTPVSRSAHLQADLVVTPMNDSFVDFDVLGLIDPLSLELVRPSLYTRVIQEARATRESHGCELDWVVLRNRIVGSDPRNRERLTHGLEALARQADFRIGPSLRERVAYREMFPFGLTIADLSPGVRPADISAPRLAAREELRDLLIGLKLIPRLAPTVGVGDGVAVAPLA